MPPPACNLISGTILAMGLGLEEVSKSTVQNAIDRLARRNLITAMGQGRYQFENRAFATWIRERYAGQ
jgi:predicted transcriptional regulator